MGENKPFAMVVQLVKSQIWMEKLLRKVSIDDALPNLSLMIEKYEWLQPNGMKTSQPPLTNS